MQFSFTYDGNNNQTSQFNQSWNGNSWYNSEQVTRTYDQNNFVKIDTYKYWNSDGIEVQSGDSSYYYYHTVITRLDGLKDGTISIYPNPSKGKFTLISQGIIKSLEVFTISGQRINTVYNIKPHSTNEIDLTGNPKGIYFLKFHDGSRIINQKVIIQ
jgi:hypothetical protein